MRIGELSGIELQPRDIALLCGLFESRVMTLSHITALYFDGKQEMAKKRSQKLKAAGLIRVRPRRYISEPSVLFLTRRTFEVLRENGCLSQYPKITVADFENRASVSDLTIRHELEVMDVKTAMTAAVNRHHNLRLAEFSTWPALYQFNAYRLCGERVVVKPDGFIRVQEKKPDGRVFEDAYFLEVDRSTETLDVLCQRAHCYSDYYRSGGFALRNGAFRENYKKFPFRVFWVCKSVKRRDNFAKRLLSSVPPILTQALIGTMDDAMKDPLGVTWANPLDYREAEGENNPRSSKEALYQALRQSRT